MNIEHCVLIMVLYNMLLFNVGSVGPIYVPFYCRVIGLMLIS